MKNADTCPLCGSQNGIRLCLKCRTAHLFDLSSSRYCPPLLCPHAWHESKTDLAQANVRMLAKSLRRGFPMKNLTPIALSLLVLSGCGQPLDRMAFDQLESLRARPGTTNELAARILAAERRRMAPAR